jgi:GNAT superfamily N-acetyltransferase
LPLPLPTEFSRETLVSQVLVRDAAREDFHHPGLADQYFVAAGSGLGRDIEITALTSTLRRAAENPGWFRFWAEDHSGDAYGILVVEPKPWDTEMVGVPTSNVHLAVKGKDAVARTGVAGRLLNSLTSAADHSKYLVARVPSEDVALLQALEGFGFRTVVPMVTLAKVLVPTNAGVPPGIEISAVRPGEEDAVAAISASAFRWGRFSADPGLSRHTAERVHGTWARNCALGTHAAQVLVARAEDAVVGFIALKFLNAGDTKIGSIELIAARAEVQGKGIGRALVRAGCNWLAKSASQVIVRTELPNTGALRMYEAETFQIVNGSLYLTLWR